MDRPAVAASAWMLMVCSRWVSMNSRTRRSARGGKPLRICGRSCAANGAADSPGGGTTRPGEAGCSSLAASLEFRSMAVFLLDDEIRSSPARVRARRGIAGLTTPRKMRQRRAKVASMVVNLRYLTLTRHASVYALPGNEGVERSPTSHGLYDHRIGSHDERMRPWPLPPTIGLRRTDHRRAPNRHLERRNRRRRVAVLILVKSRFCSFTR